MGFSRVKVYEDDNKWAWKFILRILAIFFDIAGIALTAWAMGRSGLFGANGDGGNYYYSDDIAFVPWNLITFSLSLIWCLTNVCLILSRSRPIHPGANVGCDLFLWLSFLVTGFFSVLGAITSLYDWDYPDSYSSSTDSGSYSYYPNGTSYYVPAQPDPCPGFSTCAQKDAVKARMKTRRNVIAAASAFALLMVLVHFALFVSACRYTHARRRNRDQRVTKEAAEIAREIIAQMAQEGRLPPMQQPLLATNGQTGGHPTSTPPMSSPAPHQQQHQSVPEIMVYGANQDDAITHAPRGQAL